MFAFVVSSFAQGVAEAPTEVKLTSGSTLRRVEVVRFEPGLVVLKHQGGIDPIRLNYIAEPHRSQLVAYEKATKKAAKNQSDAQANAQPASISGQVYIATRGAGSYKLSNAPIVVYPAAIKDSMIQAQQRNLPTRYATMGMNYNDMDADAHTSWAKTMGEFLEHALTSTVTDADGKYMVRLKTQEPVYILCFDERLAGRNTEYYSWFVEAKAGGSVDLTNYNLWIQPK